MGEGTAVAVEKNKENNLPLGRNMKNGYQRYPFQTVDKVALGLPPKRYFSVIRPIMMHFSKNDAKNMFF